MPSPAQSPPPFPLPPPIACLPQGLPAVLCPMCVPMDGEAREGDRTLQYQLAPALLLHVQQPCANTSAAASSMLDLRHGSKEQAPHVEHCGVGSSGTHTSSCSSSHPSNRRRCAWGRTGVPVPGLQQASVAHAAIKLHAADTCRHAGIWTHRVDIEPLVDC